MEFQPRSWRSNFEAVFTGAVKFKQAAGLFYVGLLTLFAVNSALFHRKWIPREYHAHRRLPEERIRYLEGLLYSLREVKNVHSMSRSWKPSALYKKNTRANMYKIDRHLRNNDGGWWKITNERTSNTFFPHEFVRFPFISHKHTAVLPLQIENPVKVCSKRNENNSRSCTFSDSSGFISETHVLPYEWTYASARHIYTERAIRSVPYYSTKLVDATRPRKTSKNNTFYPGSPRLIPVPLSPPFVPRFVPLCSLLAACRRKRRD